MFPDGVVVTVVEVVSVDVSSVAIVCVVGPVIVSMDAVEPIVSVPGSIVPKVAVFPTPVDTTSRPFSSSLVAATAAIAPATSATMKSVRRPAQSQAGESRDHISVRTNAAGICAPGRRAPHSRQYSWWRSWGAPQRGHAGGSGGGTTGASGSGGRGGRETTSLRSVSGPSAPPASGRYAPPCPRDRRP